MDSQGTTDNSNNNGDNNNAGTLWFDQSSLGPKDKDDSANNPITKDEIMQWIGRYVDKEVFEIRNLNSRRTEDEAQRLRGYQEYIRENLR